MKSHSCNYHFHNQYWSSKHLSRASFIFGHRHFWISLWEQHKEIRWWRPFQEDRAQVPEWVKDCYLVVWGRIIMIIWIMWQDNEYENESDRKLPAISRISEHEDDIRIMRKKREPGRNSGRQCQSDWNPEQWPIWEKER